MFKKPFAVNQTHKVSGADRKKIRRSVEKALQLDPSSDLLEQLLPAKSGDLELAKLPAPSRLVIYLLDGLPILLDTSGKGDYVPTVLGLWSCPSLLPVVMLKHWQVSHYITGGADVMLPGVDASRLPDFQRGDLLAVCVPGNPAPVAIGAAAMHSMAAAQQAAGQGKGKLVEVIQHYGDTLWQGLGKCAVPNDGFLQGVVAPEGAAAAAAGTGDAAGAAAAAMQQLGLSDAAAAGMDSSQGSAALAAGDASSYEAGAASSGSSTSSPWPDDMDQLLELALLQAIVKSLKDGDLPLSSSALWGHHITPSRPPGTLLDVKKSGHKKMSKFLQTYSKAGLISTREDKHSGDTILTAVNRSHALLSEYRPYKSAAASSSTGNGSSPAAGEAGGAPGTAAAGCDGGGIAPLMVEEVFKPSKDVRAVFEAVGASADGCYSASAAAEVAFEYAKQARLDQTAPDNRTLLLDALLCDALYKGLIKKGQLYPTHIAKADLREAFLRRLQPQTCISRGQQHVLRKGQPPAVQISGERRQGNKYVTRVVGVEAFLIDPSALAAECQRKYACSTSVNDLPGKNNPGQEVILQGNVIEKLPDYLMATYGIPKKYFLVKK
ncbi:hypothetical protein COO60DRAFT_1576296 [Scenedesmus sp. NREL 46B-D3]|nr:hypothetical protein COO60DRAFT_1576296 [Scenedesmus sp. NREL 46B-D3]